MTGGIGIPSAEGTTQGDPITMPIYELEILPLMSSLVSITQGINKQAAFADDLAGAGPLELLRSWRDAIVKSVPFLSYHPEPSKSWLIVKHSYLEDAKIVFTGSGIKITDEGRKHLGVVVGSQDYKLEFMNEQIDWWVRELLIHLKLL